MNRTTMPQPALELGFGLALADLYRRDGLVRLDQQFVQHLREVEPGLARSLLDARVDPGALPTNRVGLLIALAPHLEASLAGTGIRTPSRIWRRHHELAPLIFESVFVSAGP
jgi:hypothetical protein